MKNKALLLFIFLFLFSGAARAFSFDIWQHPEMAERHTIFAGAFPASIAFSYARIGDFRLDASSPEIFLDLMLPLALPFSLGFSTGLLEPGVFGAGLRLGYHLNFNDPNLDFYALYSLKLEFVEDVSAYLE